MSLFTCVSMLGIYKFKYTPCSCHAASLQAGRILARSLNFPRLISSPVRPINPARVKELMWKKAYIQSKSIHCSAAVDLQNAYH